MITMIVRILQNKFDCFIIIDGNRGLGKSTLAIHLARGVAREFKKLGSQDYKFNWKTSFVYTKKETKRFWHQWKSTGIGDELINVAFNRDFFGEEQKDIIKMINMNRDHGNLFIACLPSFSVADNQIKNLCKIRITIVRRGLAVIHTPCHSIYLKDKWDQASNEKIERKWMSKNAKNPSYTKLTTFRGLMRFPPLRSSAEAKYQLTKNAKRNLVAKEEMGIAEEEDKIKDPYLIAIQMLKDGKVKNSTFIDGFAQANGKDPSSFKRGLSDRLKKQGINHQISSYYWESISRKKTNQSVF